ncbi:MAG: PIN domain-containing protein [Leptolyngbyaceae cyanobacterium CRU_2_3]|nr:PIN domain-containing protein [Acaryochloris sp. RU_4_1]NJR64101.1 PIN domain-containing protein [Leptolyngbyaceae cyanobacterium CRU_2_3]
MRSVIADTGPLYAAYDPSDSYHSQALAEVERLTQQNLTVLLPYPVFLETHSLILKRLGIQIGFRYIQEISIGTERLQPTLEDYRTATQIIQRYPDQAITLFDATTAAISQRLRVAIWTYDFHFDVINSIVWR